MRERVETLSEEIRACRLCVEEPQGKPLPHEPRPVIQLSSTARLAICGQAPGTRVHASGRPFTDPSGDRLREWMGIGEEAFYDADRLAIVPMGFCFPGLDAKGGDLPPRKECGKTWHSRIFADTRQFELLLAVGQYAQAFHLGKRRKSSLTETVAHWREYSVPFDGGPAILPLPHPSWRNNAWLRKNPWFEADVLPFLRQEVARLL